MDMRKNDVIADLRERIQAVESDDRLMDFCSCTSSESCSKKHKREVASAVSRIDKPNMASSKSSIRTCLEGDGTAQTASDECFAKICRLLNARERCSKELVERLVRDGFNESVANEAVERARRCGLVDDVRFAETLVRSRLSQGRGVDGLGRELRSLGFDPYSVESYASLVGDNLHDREVSRAVELLERKPPRSKNPRASAYRRLATKGFNTSVAADASRMWWERQCSAQTG